MSVYQPTLDRITVFVVGTDGHLHDKYWNGKAWVWENQGAPSGGIGNGLGTLYQPTTGFVIAFVGGGNGHLYDVYFDGKVWTWEDQGVPPGTTLTGGFSWGGLSAVYQSKPDRPVVFVVGANGHLLDKYWDGKAWVWEDQGTP